MASSEFFGDNPILCAAVQCLAIPTAENADSGFGRSPTYSAYKGRIVILLHRIILRGAVVYLWIASAFGIGALAGVAVSSRFFSAAMKESERERDFTQASDRNIILHAFRRELGNWIVRRSADRFRTLCKVVFAEAADLLKADTAKQTEIYRDIVARRENYQDFDFFGTRDYVLYDDAGFSGLDEAGACYRDIVIFQTALSSLFPHWKRFNPVDGFRADHLDDYIRRIADTRFMRRVERAVEDYRIFEKGREAGNSVYSYETPSLTVRRVSHFAEIRYGVHFKDTDEYGLYGVFVPDHADRPIAGAYRSDATFQREEPLNALSEDVSA